MRSNVTGATTFQGISLPPPRPVGGVPTQPPSAWLIPARRAIPATLGSYCYGNVCVDMVEPRRMDWIHAVTLWGNQPLLVVVDCPDIKEYYMSYTPWADPVADFSPAAAQAGLDESGTLAVLTLPAPGDVSDRLLEVFVYFTPDRPATDPHVVGGSAVYLWRLNPPA